jgi:hypothetical protein
MGQVSLKAAHLKNLHNYEIIHKDTAKGLIHI